MSSLFANVIVEECIVCCVTGWKIKQWVEGYYSRFMYFYTEHLAISQKLPFSPIFYMSVEKKGSTNLLCHTFVFIITRMTCRVPATQRRIKIVACDYLLDWTCLVGNLSSLVLLSSTFLEKLNCTYSTVWMYIKRIIGNNYKYYSNSQQQTKLNWESAPTHYTQIQA